MNLRQMFPSRYLRPEDLGPGRTTVTIDKIDWQEVRNTYGKSKGDPEVLYTVFFREFKKPMKLKSTNAKTIAAVLGTDETDNWVGRQINIYPTEIRIAGEPQPVPCIYVDWVAPTSTTPQLDGGSRGTANVMPPPGGGTAAAPIDVRPIGKGSADNFRAALAEQGATFNDFLKWVRVASFETFERVFGVEIEDIPRAAAPWMMRFLKEFGAVANTTPQTEPAGQASPSTPAATPVAAKAPAGEPAPLTGDDIPF